MSDETKVDKDYKEAFNLGYELAKELNLKSPMFKKIDLGNIHMSATQDGMAQYSNEIIEEQVNKNVLPCLDKNVGISTNRDKNKGFNQSI